MTTKGYSPLWTVQKPLHQGNYILSVSTDDLGTHFILLFTNWPFCHHSLLVFLPSSHGFSVNITSWMICEHLFLAQGMFSVPEHHLDWYAGKTYMGNKKQHPSFWIFKPWIFKPWNCWYHLCWKSKPTGWVGFSDLSWAMSAGPSTLWVELHATSPTCICTLTSGIVDISLPKPCILPRSTSSPSVTVQVLVLKN